MICLKKKNIFFFYYTIKEINKKIKYKKNSIKDVICSKNKIPEGIFDMTKNIPKTWSIKDRWEWLDRAKRNDWGDLEVSNSNLRVIYKGEGRTDEDAAAIRSDLSIPGTTPFYYFEIKIINTGKEGFIGIGLCSQNVDLDRLPGWETGTGISYGPMFSKGDVVGVCYNRIHRNVFFVKNGAPLSAIFKNLFGKNLCKIFPVIGLRTKEECIEANFGKKNFEFDYNLFIENSKTNLLKKIFSTSYINSLGDFNSLERKYGYDNKKSVIILIFKFLSLIKENFYVENEISNNNFPGTFFIYFTNYFLQSNQVNYALYNKIKKTCWNKFLTRVKALLLNSLISKIVLKWVSFKIGINFNLKKNEFIVFLIAVGDFLKKISRDVVNFCSFDKKKNSNLLSLSKFTRILITSKLLPESKKIDIGYNLKHISTTKKIDCRLNFLQNLFFENEIKINFIEENWKDFTFLRLVLLKFVQKSYFLNLIKNISNEKLMFYSFLSFF
jgi:hypothetical protein